MMPLTTHPVTAKSTQRPEPGSIGQRLEQLRDELRLDVHLARMDARDRWRKLEPRMFQVERLAGHLAEISLNAMGQIAGEVKRFQDQGRMSRPRG